MKPAPKPKEDQTIGTVLAEEEHVRIKRCRNGLFMYNVNDQYIGRSLDVYGEFSESEVDLFRQLVRPGMIAVDAGANIGVHTVALANFVGPQGCVIAFEPQRVVYQMLCGNIALNGLDNVEAMRAALGNRMGSILVPGMDYRKPNNFGGVSLKTEGNGEPVMLQTLDSLGMARCDFVKIDVEGMEQEVIEGGREMLARCRPILYLENDRWEKSASLIGCLRQAGYMTYWHLAKFFNPNNYFGSMENLYPGLFSFNVVCLPPSSGVDLTGFIEVTPETAATPPIP